MVDAIYLTYVEYTNYGGTLDETTYNEYEFEAETLINHYTFNRLANDTDFPIAVKRLVYALVKMVENKSEALTLGNSIDGKSVAPVTKQVNDGVSIEYNVMSAFNLFQLCKNDVHRTIHRYLGTVVNEAGQKVLYRGLYQGE